MIERICQFLDSKKIHPIDVFALLASIGIFCFIGINLYAAQLNNAGQNHAKFFSGSLHTDDNSVSDILDTAVMKSAHVTLTYQRTGGTGNLTFRIQSSAEKTTWFNELEITNLVNTSSTVLDFDKDLTQMHRFFRVETVNSDPGPTTFTVAVDVSTRGD